MTPFISEKLVGFFVFYKYTDEKHSITDWREYVVCFGHVFDVLSVN